jgi:hypothetical protein
VQNDLRKLNRKNLISVCGIVVRVRADVRDFSRFSIHPGGLHEALGNMASSLFLFSLSSRSGRELATAGLNIGCGDAMLKALLKDPLPARVCADKPDAVANNEIWIDWQAAPVFLLTSQLR